MRRGSSATLPWVERATVRKFYPSTLAIEITERKPFALWQHDGEVLVMDRNGVGIVPLDDLRFAKLPFMVGGGANETAKPFLADLLTQPDIAGQMHDAVLVGEPPLGSAPRQRRDGQAAGEGGRRGACRSS